MGVSGKLETMALADLLQMLAQGRSTGTLRVSNGGVVKSIFFREGVVVSSASSDPKEYLGHFLVAHGHLTEDELATAIRAQREERALLGRILVDRGAISEADLEAMLVLKAEESLFELFSWASGDFQFLDRELPEWEMVPISLGVEGLLLEGMRRIDEWQRIRERIPSPQAVPVAVAALGVGDDLTERDRVILALVDDDRSIEEIGLEAHTGGFEVCRVLYRELGRGRLKIVRPRPVSAAEADVEPDASMLLDRARELLQLGRYQRALRHVRASSSLAPDDPELRAGARALERQLSQQLEAEGFVGSAVPEMVTGVVPADAGLSPEEGFVLSRVDGRSRVDAILAVSPMPELEARVVIWKLRQLELVRLNP
jgi:hypothetical protein